MPLSGVLNFLFALCFASSFIKQQRNQYELLEYLVDLQQESNVALPENLNTFISDNQWFWKKYFYIMRETLALFYLIMQLAGPFFALYAFHDSIALFGFDIVKAIVDNNILELFNFIIPSLDIFIPGLGILSLIIISYFIYNRYQTYKSLNHETGNQSKNNDENGTLHNFIKATAAISHALSQGWGALFFFTACLGLSWQFAIPLALFNSFATFLFFLCILSR